MKLFLQCVVFWCVLATLVCCSRSTRPELSAESRKRLSVWLQSLVRRDVHRRLSVREEDSVNKLEESRSSKPLTPLLRVKRTSSSIGCNLVTCSVHDLAHRLQVITKQKTESAPPHKIGANGYGRRRRRSLEQLFPSLVSLRGQAQRSRARNSSSSSTHTTAFRRT